MFPYSRDVFPRGTHITRDMCFPGRGTHITKELSVSQVGEHISLGTWCFPGRGTHITRSCVSQEGNKDY